MELIILVVNGVIKFWNGESFVGELTEECQFDSEYAETQANSLIRDGYTVEVQDADSFIACLKAGDEYDDMVWTKEDKMKWSTDKDGNRILVNTNKPVIGGKILKGFQALTKENLDEITFNPHSEIAHIEIEYKGHTVILIGNDDEVILRARYRDAIYDDETFMWMKSHAREHVIDCIINSIISGVAEQSYDEGFDDGLKA